MDLGVIVHLSLILVVFTCLLLSGGAAVYLERARIEKASVLFAAASDSVHRMMPMTFPVIVIA